ncbi:MAG: hypothetical protein H0X51_02055 [Parachlamydiaceae bacterium]|nr:hypothetical protein [Parachlamydiaceae bacterium]
MTTPTSFSFVIPQHQTPVAAPASIPSVVRSAFSSTGGARAAQLFEPDFAALKDVEGSQFPDGLSIDPHAKPLIEPIAIHLSPKGAKAKIKLFKREMRKQKAAMQYQQEETKRQATEGASSRKRKTSESSLSEALAVKRQKLQSGRSDEESLIAQAKIPLEEVLLLMIQAVNRFSLPEKRKTVLTQMTNYFERQRKKFEALAAQKEETNHFKMFQECCLMHKELVALESPFEPKEVEEFLHKWRNLLDMREHFDPMLQNPLVSIAKLTQGPLKKTMSGMFLQPPSQHALSKARNDLGDAIAEIASPLILIKLPNSSIERYTPTKWNQEVALSLTKEKKIGQALILIEQCKPELQNVCREIVAKTIKAELSEAEILREAAYLIGQEQFVLAMFLISAIPTNKNAIEQMFHLEQFCEMRKEWDSLEHCRELLEELDELCPHSACVFFAKFIEQSIKDMKFKALYQSPQKRSVIYRDLLGLVEQALQDIASAFGKVHEADADYNS